MSLFPLAGRISALRGFFPSGYREWFVVLSTVFSLVVYLRIQFSFQTLYYFVPISWSAILAAVLLLIYTFLHLSLKKSYATLRPWQLSLAIVLLLTLYLSSIALLTYTFNVLDVGRGFRVFRGKVVFADSGETARGAKVIFRFRSDESQQLTSTNMLGQFVKIVPDETADQLSAVRARYYDSASGQLTYSNSWVSGDLTADPFWKLDIYPISR